MLPRLRFVFAAALIGALPWLLLGTGLVTTYQNTPVTEYNRGGTGVAISAGDLRDSHHMHALAYVRRSRELERLRELATSPLSEWVAAPAGPAASELSLVETRTETAFTPAPAPSEPVPESTVVASVPAEPAAAPEAPAAIQSAAIPPETLAAPASSSTPVAEEAMQAAIEASVDVPANLSNVDWAKMVPPLPRARTAEEHRKTTGRRLRTKRAFIARPPQFQANPVPTQPNPFGGPPATATTYNPGRNSSAIH